MKAFFDLQVGDKIYYYDKFKIHEQIIHDISLVKKQEERRGFWSGEKIVRTNYLLTIKAGKNSIIEIVYYTDKNPKDANFKDNYKNDYLIYTVHSGGMPRFSNYEKALEYITHLKAVHENRAYKIRERLNKEEKIISKYEINENI